MKFVIWGCGVIGQRLIYRMGAARKVAAIVEANKELHGSTYCGIPIVSFDEFLLAYSAYPVIVTPHFFEDEIMVQLKCNNIIWSFPFSKERGQIESILVQLPIDQTLKRYKDNNRLAIYGASLLGLILYDLFSENGFEVSLVIPHNTNALLKEYAEKILKLKTIPIDDIKKNGMKLLLAAGLEETDRSKLCGVLYDKYYDLHLQNEWFYQPELEKFKDIHKGERCFIVATGPSLRPDDLDTLYNNREICISVNGIFKIFDKTKWIPNYYVVVDPDIDQWKDGILEIAVRAKFVADVVDCFNDKHYDNIYRWHLIRKENNQGFPDFSDNFARGGCISYAGGTVVYSAMQLAVYMGFKEIYLLGTDCTVSFDGTVPHFDTNYYCADRDFSSSDMSLWPNEIMRSYQVAKQYADLHDIKIYNATRGGELEIFPRVDFDALFS